MKVREWCKSAPSPQGCVLRMGTGELMCQLFKGMPSISFVCLGIVSSSEYHGSKMIPLKKKMGINCALINYFFISTILKVLFYIVSKIWALSNIFLRNWGCGDGPLPPM